VLNIGLQAGILTPRVFAMFVLDALFLTFCTTPVVTYLYPPRIRVRAGTTSVGATGVEGGRHDDGPRRIHPGGLIFTHRTRFTVLLDKFDHLPGVMSLSQLLAFSTSSDKLISSSTSTFDSVPSKKEMHIMDLPMSVTALRLVELTERSSAIMKSAIAESLAHRDPLLKVFRTVGDLNDAIVDNRLKVVPLNSFGVAAAASVRESGSDLLILGWTPIDIPQQHHHHGDDQFDYMLRLTNSDSVAAIAAAQVIRGVFKDAASDVALFMDQRSSASESYGHKHIFMPFFGGADDRAALQLVVQLCLNPRLSATVVRVTQGDEVKSTLNRSDEKFEAVTSGFTIQNVSTYSFISSFSPKY
jgi:hypothetical protein